MCAPTESAPTESAPAARRHRHGSALLLAVVTTAVIAITTLALWRAAAGTRRSANLELTGAGVESTADSAVALALGQVAAGGWRQVAAPGDTATLNSGTSARGAWLATVGRLGWHAIMIRAHVTERSGVPRLAASADRRVLVPLRLPMLLPTAAVTGAGAWTIDSAAIVQVPVAAGAERVCRVGAAVTGTAIAPWLASFDTAAFVAVDPDTVRDSLVGAIRLTRGHLTRPLRVTGMVVLGSELLLGADLEITGVLIARGSVAHAGGRLAVTGAVVTGDAGGGHSGLGPGDRVRYDACAIRRAVEHVTSPGPASTWTHLTLF